MNIEDSILHFTATKFGCKIGGGQIPISVFY